MNKLEVGMYVRTKRNGIGKILSFELQDEEDYCFIELPHRRTGIKFFNIVKASYNIIDLIEVGDYVNGYKVYEVDRECCRITLNGGDYDSTFRLTYLRPALGENMGIKSILTKEMFEQMKYEVK